MRPATAWIGIGLVIASASAARAQANKAAAQEFREVFLRLDANGDQVLERDEVPEAGRAAFDRLLKRGDANHDGKLQAEELRAMGQKLRVLADPEARFAAMDRDGDGKVSRSEFPGRPRMFDRLDADQDGFLTRAEAAPFAAPPAPGPAGGAPEPGQVARRLRGMDKDGDGRVSRSEFTGPPKLFDRLDSNRDGVLSGPELLGPAARPAGATKPKS